MNWASVQLKHVARLGYGDALPSDDDERTGTVAVYGSNGAYSVFSRANTQAPVIIVGRKGSYGKVNWSDVPVYVSDTTFYIDSTTTNVHLRWLYYVLQSLKLDVGSNEAAVPGLNRETAYRQRILLPQLNEQRAIADFLDRETAKIDALIAKKQRLLELLAERRQALITHAVTKGLDLDVPMKDSGVEWLGRIPENWEVLRLRSLIFGIDTGISPQAYNYPTQVGEWGVLKTGCVNGGIFDPNENKALPPEIEAPLDLEVKVGDVLMSRASGSVELIGSVALVEGPLSVHLLLSDKTFRLRVNSNVYDKNFFVAVMGSFFLRQQILQIISGAPGLANNIAQSDLRELLLPVPPLEEQYSTMNYLEQKTKKLDQLYQKVRNMIERLKERRIALISEAVTGKIKVAE